ncbi:MAG: hypothetical protein R3182_02080 [Draconibacterium sp.]|nr:hypothetical protein [Draconibacterium sp.]
MNSKLKIWLGVISILLLFSCDYKKTHVINTVHKDGSVTRKITVETNTSKYLDFEEVNVPIDSSWKIETTMHIKEAVKAEEEDDTIWYLTAEKHFRNVDEINDDYQHDTGANRDLKRGVEFTKRFRWFTTVYRYAETVEQILTINCPLSDYLNTDEIEYVYLPNKVQGELKNGPDSLYYKKFAVDIENKVEKWFWTSEIRQWVDVFYDLFGDDPDLTISKEEMLSKEAQFADFLMNNDNDEDENENQQDSIFIALYGNEFYSSFKNEIDSSISVVDEIDKAAWSYSEYDLEIRMPGEISATNGYAITDDENGGGKGILWTVKGECFLTRDFEMWAESRVNNYLLWFFTAVFVLFVVAGFVRFQRKK